MKRPPRSGPPGLRIERRSLTEPIPQISLRVSRRGWLSGHGGGVSQRQSAESVAAAQFPVHYELPLRVERNARRRAKRKSRSATSSKPGGTVTHPLFGAYTSGWAIPDLPRDHGFADRSG